jgi:hypothetical protein
MNMRPKTSTVFRYLASAFGLGALIGWSSPSDAYIQQIVIDQTATVNFEPIILGTSLPAPRHPIRSTRAGYLVNSSQMILTTRSSQISTLRPRIMAGLNTLLTLRLSPRALQHSAADS